VKGKFKFTFYIVWGENSGPEKFQFQVSLKQPYIFRFVVYNFGICLIKRDIEEVVSDDLKVLDKLQSVIYDMVLAYDSKGNKKLHEICTASLKRALLFSREEDEFFIRSVYEKSLKGKVLRKYYN